ncbi:MAG: proton-conducting transporter membrane subunit, partial [Pseudomonadota bacterium]
MIVRSISAGNSKTLDPPGAFLVIPILPSFSFLAPLALVLVAILAGLRPGRRPGIVPRLSEVAALVSLALTAAGLAQVIAGAATPVATLGGAALIGFRADLVSASMALLVGFIGWIVMRYSRTYLDGEAREGTFHSLMLTTLASVLVFVQAGTFATLALATLAVGLSLKRLLLFYPERPEAQRAATKFALVWHAGDAFLFAAYALLFARFGTGDLGALANAASAQGLGLAGTVAAACIVIAAALKTAAFPLHGWL